MCFELRAFQSQLKLAIQDSVVVLYLLEELLLWEILQSYLLVFEVRNFSQQPDYNILLFKPHDGEELSHQFLMWHVEIFVFEFSLNGNQRSLLCCQNQSIHLLDDIDILSMIFTSYLVGLWILLQQDLVLMVAHEIKPSILVEVRFHIIDKGIPFVLLGGIYNLLSRALCHLRHNLSVKLLLYSIGHAVVDIHQKLLFHLLFSLVHCEIVGYRPLLLWNVL